jgi:hypothetical protein
VVVAKLCVVVGYFRNGVAEAARSNRTCAQWYCLCIVFRCRSKFCVVLRNSISGVLGAKYYLKHLRNKCGK